MWPRRTKERHYSVVSSTPEADEEYANAFAAALLMPEDEVRRRVRIGRNTQQLATEFGVELTRMKDRLVGLDLYEEASDPRRQ